MTTTAIPPEVFLLHQLNRSVIPIGVDKRPFRLLKWKPYQVDIPTQEQLEIWASWEPPAWAQVTGAISGVITLDFDGARGVALREHWELQPHRRTGSGGEHVDIMWPGFHVPTLNGKAKEELGRLFPGLDVKGDGGYAIVCGHNSAGAYTWLRDPEPDPTSVAPQALWDFLTNSKATEQPETGHFDTPHAGQESDLAKVLLRMAVEHGSSGNRNNAGFWLACQLRDNRFTRFDADEVMRVYVGQVGAFDGKGRHEPYTWREAESSLEQAYGQPAREPWHDTIEMNIPRNGTTSNGNGAHKQEEDSGGADAEPDNEGTNAKAKSTTGSNEEQSFAGWTARTGGIMHGTYRTGKGAVLPEALFADEIVTVDGLPVGVTARIVSPDNSTRSVYLPAECVTSRDPAAVIYQASGVSYIPEEAKHVRHWAGDAMNRSTEIPRVEGLLRPDWKGDHVSLPGGAQRLVPGSGMGWLALYGKHADTREDLARMAWQEIIAIALENPKLMTLMGAATISLFLKPLGRHSFIFHTVGDSRQGKTRGTDTAMAVYGDPAALVRNWNSTRNAILERLNIARILPVALDETAAAGARDELIEAILFSAVTGVGRGRAGRSGGLRDEGEWKNVVISTGERRLVTASGLTGARARVVEVQAPVTRTANAIDRCHELACENFGWPLTWFQQRTPNLAQIREQLDIAEGILKGYAKTAVGRTLAEHLALCAVGFEQLGLWTGNATPFIHAVNAAELVLHEAESTMEGDGTTAADRLLSAVFEHVVRRNWAFPWRDSEPEVLDGRDQDGISLADAVAVLPRVVKQIAKDIGLADPDAALRDLRNRGDLLIPGDGKNLAKLIKLKGMPTRMYVFRKPDEEEVTTDDY